MSQILPTYLVDQHGVPIDGTNPLPTSGGGGGGIVDQGKQGSIAAPWFVQPTADGATVSLPLPTGAATDAKQDTGNTSLASIDGKIATAVAQATGNASLSSIDTKLTSQATAANQTSGNATLTSILGQFDSKTSTLATATKQDSQITLATTGNATAVSILGQLDAKTSTLATAAKQPAIGTAGTPSADVLSVQGTGSDNSANPSAGKLYVVAAKASAAAPAWTEGNAVPLSTDLIGRVRTVASANTSSVTGSITARDVASSTATGQNNQSIVTGSPTAGSFVTSTLLGANTCRFVISGTWTGTIQPELSADGGTTWTPLSAHVTQTPLSTLSWTANGSGNFPVGGATNVRLRAVAAWTGTANITLIISQDLTSVYVANNAMRIIDGTTGSTTQAVVKAASTAATTTDTSLVVALSPNSPATVVGAAASGAATAGNPVLIGGLDTTNARTIRTDTSGNLSIVGGGTAGSAVSTRPLQIGGSDGTNLQTLAVDTAGRIVTAPAKNAQLITTTTAATTLKSGAGVFRGFVIQNASSDGSGGLYIYDNTAASGTAFVGMFTTQPLVVTGLDIPFSTGLTVQITTAACPILFMWD